MPGQLLNIYSLNADLNLWSGNAGALNITTADGFVLSADAELTHGD